MKQYSKIFLIIFGIMLFNQAIGLSQYNSALESDPEATQLLNQIKTNIESSQAYTLDYSMSIEYPGSATEYQKGSIIQKGNNYKLELQEQHIYAFEETIWTLDVNEKEVLVDDRELTDGPAFSPNQMLDFYSTGEFVYTIFNSEPSQNGTRYYLEFKPLDDMSQYSKLRMTIQKTQTPELEELTVFNKDGSRYKFSIDNLDLTTEVNDSVFQFRSEDYPNVIIEDIRL